jgi:hypothetical protein
MLSHRENVQKFKFWQKSNEKNQKFFIFDLGKKKFKIKSHAVYL